MKYYNNESIFFFPRTSVFLGAIALFCSGLSLAQISETGFGSSVTGVVTLEDGQSVSRYAVEVEDMHGRGTVWTDVRPDGSFDVMTFAPAQSQYQLRVLDSRGRVVHRDVVQTASMPIEIHVHTKPKEKPVQGVVSVQDLLEPIPKKALREYVRAEKAAAKGKIEGAIRHLRKAIEIHPAFSAAHNSLGVKYMMLRNYSDAAVEFEATVQLEPDHPQPMANLGMALHGLRQYEEAEKLLRRSLELDPSAKKSLYALALVLLSRGPELDEVLAMLLEVSDEIPEARLYAAGVMLGKENRRGAMRQIRAYLASEDDDHREGATKWLSDLEARETTASGSSTSAEARPVRLAP